MPVAGKDYRAVFIDGPSKFVVAGLNFRCGRYDYVVGRRMISGFGLVAHPEAYGNTGIMTFVTNHLGRVYQKDLGAIDSLSEFDPDDTWEVVEPDPSAAGN